MLAASRCAGVDYIDDLDVCSCSVLDQAPHECSVVNRVGPMYIDYRALHVPGLYWHYIPRDLPHWLQILVVFRLKIAQ